MYNLCVANGYSVHCGPCKYHCCISGTHDYICPVDTDSLIAAEEYSLLKPDPAPAEFMELANIIMADNNKRKPNNPDDALQLYHLLKYVLES